MDPRSRAPLVLAAMALLLAGLAAVLLDRPETGPPVPSPEERAAQRSGRLERARLADGTAAADAPDAAGDRSAQGTARAPTRAGHRSDPAATDRDDDAGPTTPDAPGAPRPTPEGEREPREDDPTAREQLLEEAVLAVITAAAPELGDVQVERSCDADGNLCVVEGPWPGDDFLARWVTAIADGAVGRDDLNGVTFQSFEVVEHADGKRFSVTAVAPR